MDNIENIMNDLTYRIVIDGNGKYRIQYAYIGFALAGQPKWHFSPEIYSSVESAKEFINSHVVKEIVEEM